VVVQRGTPLPPAEASDARSTAKSDFSDPAEVKKLLSAVWSKDHDSSETYEFELGGATSWGCVRKNDMGTRRFQLQYDKEKQQLWWGGSYYLEPAELAKQPSLVKWYKSADAVKRKAAFTWNKVRDVPLAVSQAKESKASGSRSMGELQRQPRFEAGDASSYIFAGDGRSSSSKGGSHTWPPPEVIINRENLLVIYKPPYWKCELPEGGVREPGSDQSSKKQDEQVLLQWLRDKVPDIRSELFAEEFNPALSGTGFGPLSHRIDAETSGPLMVAKTKEAQKHIKSQFYNLEVSKRYVCLVHGRVSQSSGEIKDSIRTIRTATSTRSEISSAGEWAQTNYQVIATYSGGASKAPCTLVACDIKSGRTHQIRVHMQSLGHSLVSDDKYQEADRVKEDRSWCPRLFLHCYRLCFRNTRNESELVICPLPPDLKSALMSLGAADESGHFTDNIFGETSWQREVLRPPLTSWQPGTALLRKVVEILQSAETSLTLDELAEKEEVKELLAEEGASRISKNWLSKHWRVFQAEPTGENGDVRVELRVGQAEGPVDEVTLEQQLETVQSELEELRRQKQRAVAQEDYKRAEQLKHRMEAASAELNSLLAFQQGAGAEEGAGAHGGSVGAFTQPKRPAIFAEDVSDEKLFPSLAPTKSSAQSMSVQRSQASSASARGSAAQRAASASAATMASSRAQEESEAAAEKIPDLPTAIYEFLEVRQGCVAMLNDVNNNKYLRSVMGMQKPKPLAAVNKAWFKNHEDTFVLLSSSDGETYVGLVKQLQAQAKARAKKGAQALRLPGAGEAKAPVQPAYKKVIQKIAGPDDVAPLVYDYAEAPKDSSKPTEWQDMFLAVLRNTPQRYCKAEDLLASVPKFAQIMGAPKPKEQRELLVVFLESFKDTFKVEQRGSGAEREVIVWAR